MSEVERFAKLRDAVRLGGGIRAVAAKAEIDPSNMSRFLKSGRGLSLESVRLLEAALGRPGGQARPSSVVVVKSSSVGGELARGLAWYLPEGGEVARAAWSGLRSNNFRKFIKGVIGRFVPEVYAIRDECGTRLILVLATGLVLPESYFSASAGPGLRWFHTDRQHAVLNLGNDPEIWLNGGVTPERFDASWPTTGSVKTADDVIALIKRMDITFEEAVRRIVDNE